MVYSHQYFELINFIVMHRGLGKNKVLNKVLKLAVISVCQMSDTFNHHFIFYASHLIFQVVAAGCEH